MTCCLHTFVLRLCESQVIGDSMGKRVHSFRIVLFTLSDSTANDSELQEMQLSKKGTPLVLFTPF